MANRNERMIKLNDAGVDTKKYFNINLPEGLRPGATISVVINDDGQPMIVESKVDEIAEQIITDGYVRNTKLHRRFVMAQMFHMLDYVSYDGRESGFNACLNKYYGYHYTLTMMLDEVRVLHKLEQRDKESFDERSHFFTKEVVIAVLEDYIGKLEKYIDTLPDRKCKGVPYKRIKGENIFNADLDKKLYAPLRKKLNHVRSAHNYATIYLYVKDFMKDMIKLPYDTPKSKVWVDAYKGEGAYYTLKNLIMFHDCKIMDSRFHTTDVSMNILKFKLDQYRGEGWRMFALMKKVIADNNFSFKDAMAKVYSEK